MGLKKRLEPNGKGFLTQRNGPRRVIRSGCARQNSPDVRTGPGFDLRPREVRDDGLPCHEVSLPRARLSLSLSLSRSRWVGCVGRCRSRPALRSHTRCDGQAEQEQAGGEPARGCTERVLLHKHVSEHGQNERVRIEHTCIHARTCVDACMLGCVHNS